MPIYVYSCQQCNGLFEKMMRMADYAVPLDEPCPQCGVVGSIQQQLTAPNFCQSTVMGKTRVPAGFTQVLDRIGAANPGNTLNQTNFARTREI